MVLKFYSDNEAQTRQIAESIGKCLRGNEVVELIGDVGSGKTTFVKGLACGAGSQDTVTSPSFALKQQYEGRVNINHYDFYRLDDAGIMRHEIDESLGSGVAVVEWGQTVDEVLPQERVKVVLEPTDEHKREINITAPRNLEYLK